MTVNFVPATLNVDPVFRFSALASLVSTTATLAVESAELKLCPEVIVPELSGPSDPLARSTPVTLKLLLLIEDLAPDAEPPAEPPDPVALIVPDSLRSVRVSAPAVADT